MKTINLSEILQNISGINDFNNPGDHPLIIAAMREACNQLIGLCAEKAEIHFPDHFDKYVRSGTKIPEIDKTSIFNLKNQII